MEDETLLEDSQPEANAEGEQSSGENVSDALTLDQINKELGKEFKDVATAIKSIKDTQSYVGKKVEPTVDPSIKEKVDNLESQLNEANFYRENSAYDNPETRALIKELGGDPKEVVEKEVFKTIFEKTSAYDKSQESKSVLHNSSRLGQASTKMDEATTAMDKANDAASSGNVTEALRQKGTAEKNAVDAVVDSFS